MFDAAAAMTMLLQARNGGDVGPPGQICPSGLPVAALGLVGAF